MIFTHVYIRNLSCDEEIKYMNRTTADGPIERKAGGCCWATANCEGTDVNCLSNPTANWSLRWCSASLLYTSNCVCWTLKVESFAPGPNWRPIRIQQLNIANASSRCWQKRFKKDLFHRGFFYWCRRLGPYYRQVQGEPNEEARTNFF